MSFIDTHHPDHSTYHESHSYLYHFVQRYSQYQPHHMLFALIIALHPTLNRCNEILLNPHSLPTFLLHRMLNYLKHYPTLLPYREHVLDKFYKDHSNLLSKPTSIHQELYDYITTQHQLTFDNIAAKFSILPPSLIQNTITCKNPILRYNDPSSPPTHPPPQIHNSTCTSNLASLFTWNIATLATSLPCIYKLIQQHKPAIITLQKTKLTSKKPPKYLKELFSNYTLYFNNTHHLFQPNTYYPYIPPRGGLLTLIHSKYNFPNNIHKITTSTETSPTSKFFISIIYH